MPTSKVSHVAIVGGGIAGPTLAGILVKRLGAGILIDIMERGAPDQDQGYGLDLDMHGQKALALAGVYHRYWEISRPNSDVMKFYPLRGSKPMFVMCRPKALQTLLPSMFGAQPESNRAGIRKILLEEMESQGNVTVRYKTSPASISEVDDGHGSMAELFNKQGETLGKFDLVVDASGLHSCLRQYRVNDTQGKHYTGRMMIHGVIKDPEEKASNELVERLGQGTLIALGRGYMICLQRFGADPEDHRTAFFYNVSHENENGLAEEIGLQKATSRQEGIHTDAESLAKVKAWLHGDMGEHFDETYHQAVDCLDCVTVRGMYSHGDSSLRETSTLPLVCIGDALLNIGLGGGGNLAMQDSIELADCLCQEGCLNCITGRANMQVLHAAETHMFERKIAFDQERKEKMSIFGMARPEDGADATLSIRDLVGGNRLVAFLAGSFAHVFRFADWWEQWRGKAGSGSSSRIFPEVARNCA